jgi:hypothetical protein
VAVASSATTTDRNQEIKAIANLVKKSLSESARVNASA